MAKKYKPILSEKTCRYCMAWIPATRKSVCGAVVCQRKRKTEKHMRWEHNAKANGWKPARKPMVHLLVFCKICLEQFDRGSSARIYCGDECARIYLKISYQDSNRRRRTFEMRSRVYKCLMCGKLFTPSYRSKVRTVCSSMCNDERDRIGRKRGKKERKALKRGCAIGVRFLDRDIYERDRWVCQLCGKRIHKGKKAPHPLSPSIDHIVPLSKGGQHGWANVQAAHFICNSTKGAKLIGQLRLV